MWASSWARVLVAWAGCEVVSDDDRAGEVVGRPVRRPAVPADQRKPRRLELLGEPSPERQRRVILEEGRHDVREPLPLGLGDVEDVDDPEPPEDPGERGAVPLVALVDRAGPVDARGEDGDAVLPFAHLPAERPPGPVPGDSGRVGALAEDQEHVVRAVGVEPSRQVEHAPPVLAARQRLDRLDEPLVGLC